MNPTIKAILGVVAAGITTFVVIAFSELAMGTMYPAPHINPEDVAAINAYLSAAPWHMFVLIAVSHFLATTAAGWVGTRITGKITTAITIGIVFMVFAGQNIYYYSGHPGWFWATLVVYPLGAYMGYLFASKRADAVKS